MTQTGLLSLVPFPSSGHIPFSLEPVEDLHPALLPAIQPGVKFLGANVLGRWISEPTVEFALVPLGHRDLTGVSGKTIPNVLDELKTFVRWETKDFVAKGLRCHPELSARQALAARPRRVTPNGSRLSCERLLARRKERMVGAPSDQMRGASMKDFLQ